MEQLSERERKLTGFALFSLSMKIGPPSFSAMEELIDKIEVRAEFEFYAKDWIEYANSKKTIKPPHNERGSDFFTEPFFPNM